MLLRTVAEHAVEVVLVLKTLFLRTQRTPPKDSTVPSFFGMNTLCTCVRRFLNAGLTTTAHSPLFAPLSPTETDSLCTNNHALYHVNKSLSGRSLPLRSASQPPNGPICLPYFTQPYIVVILRDLPRRRPLTMPHQQPWQQRFRRDLAKGFSTTPPSLVGKSDLPHRGEKWLWSSPPPRRGGGGNQSNVVSGTPVRFPCKLWPSVGLMVTEDPPQLGSVQSRRRRHQVGF